MERRSCPRSQRQQWSLGSGVPLLPHAHWELPFPFQIEIGQAFSFSNSKYFVWMLFSRSHLTQLNYFSPWRNYKNSIVPLLLPIPHSDSINTPLSWLSWILMGFFSLQLVLWILSPNHNLYEHSEVSFSNYNITISNCPLIIKV